LPRLDSVIATGIAHAETLSARSLQAAVHGRTRLFKRIQSWFDRFDILVTPTLTCPPLPATYPGSGDIEIDGRPAGDIRAAWAPTLGLFTMTGHPALSLNCGWTDDGLPIGLQLVGRWHQDWLLLRAGRLLQNGMRHAAWRMPPL
jgi:aspartyl-tRNA(Asn)/glutamyl-tRNA(Gln) amidotransferase subunit A